MRDERDERDDEQRERDDEGGTSGENGNTGNAPVAPLLTLAKFELSEVQCAFVECRERFSFYVGGLGAGKTHAGAVRAILRAAHHPGSLGLVGAPTYTMLRDTTQRTFFELLPPVLNAGFVKQEGLLRLANGSEVLFRSLDAPDRVRGLNLAWFWLDEAPLAGYYAWQVLKGRLRQRGFDPAGWATGTPHGRDGYWRDFESQPRAHHALLRATTYANIHNLPPGYLEGLGYTGTFRRQEVYGLFVAFEGLVYAFDPGPYGHVAEPPEDTLWTEVIGGVDWGFTNPSVAVLFGLDGDGRAWQFDEFYQRRAALEETLLPAILDLTRRYGVTRWYCGPDEPEHIAALSAALSAAGLGAVALKGDNAIRPGIQTITALLARRTDGTRGLRVAPRCVHTITEYGSYQYPSEGDGSARDDAGRPGAAEVPLKRDDHCLGAGTPILTSTGEQAIETVQAGDLVLTRKGYRHVLAAGCTNAEAEVYCVEFSNGVRLVGTGNHPVWVVGRGWFPIDALRYAMQVETASITETASCQRTAMTSIQNQCASDMRSLSISTASRSVATPLITVTGHGTTTCLGQEIDRRATNRITEKSGSGRTGRYQKGITSTTLTGTRSTIGWRTFNVCQERSTCCAITVSWSLSTWRGSVSGLTPSVLRLRLGIGQRRVGSGTLGTARKPGRVASRGCSVATTAGLSFSQGMGWHASTAIVRTNAGLLRAGRDTRMTRDGRVHGAGLSSAATATPICDSAPVRVLHVTSMPGRVPVFNLTVEGEPEYYAAGVLVHNCMDATRYALHTHLSQSRAAEAYLGALRQRALRHGS